MQGECRLSVGKVSVEADHFFLIIRGFLDGSEGVRDFGGGNFM